MQGDELLFELYGPDGQVWRVYLDGRAEGFPHGTVLTNHAWPMLHVVQGGLAAWVPDLPSRAALKETIDTMVADAYRAMQAAQTVHEDGSACKSGVTEGGQPGQTPRSGWEVVPHNVVQLIAHQERLWVLGRVELPDQPAQSAAVGLLESFGLAWKILLWGIRQSIRAGAPR